MELAWIDYYKTKNMIPDSCIKKSLKMFCVANNIKRFISEGMNLLNTKFETEDKIKMQKMSR